MRNLDESIIGPMLRRNFCGAMLAAGAVSRHARSEQLTPQQSSQPAARPVLERFNPNRPHQGKVLLAVQAHSDDIPLSAAGTVAKLIEEGYTGYLLRASNDDMGDAPGLGTPGTIGDHVSGN